jgi:argininosuccinate synthase
MVNEKDLQSYLKIAAPALPCRAARKEFSSYVHNVARDISIENPDADFETIANMLGATPKQAAIDFVECANRHRQYHNGVFLRSTINIVCDY